MEENGVQMPQEVETERLLMRLPCREDGVAVNAAIVASFAELQPWLPFAQSIPPVLETTENLMSAREKFLAGNSFRYLLFLKESGAFVGTASIQGVDWELPKCEIGYWLHSEHSGHGYMREAVQKLVELGLQQAQFKRMEIRCETENIKSRAIAEALGFELEGILRNDDWSADGLRLTDTCIYAVIA
ncbi:N-acetyltransferase GCN5 [Fictibacillus macauensis ZFHKF-1]|uniref:N-acetyltransferase GCN5 n=1 Tax=Fictibacillus macauensis ZFHKF-1 TaxID=1196324 RepID=I8UH26_9BACL|nr:GNAT family N-acetyltransferase [Fictibacillus macauensis]EIT86205.1 N-acetyltransferase GCN5 [Fictibacillus macauensis ZFHKF-1]